MLLHKMGPEVPSRARTALPALQRNEKEGGHRPPKFSRIINSKIYTRPFVSDFEEMFYIQKFRDWRFSKMTGQDS